jgi:probable phosphoglycerate mutase
VTVTTLLWVRHGEADSNRDGRFGGHSPAALTTLGLEQAARTGAAMVAHAPTAIVSSDLMRARQTAEAIGAACALPIEFDPALRERSLGILDGLSFTETEEKHPALWARLRARDHDLVPDGGEHNRAVFDRVTGAIDRIVEAHAGGRVVVVSHGIALYHAFLHVCGLGTPSPDHRVFTLLDNCSISRFEHRPGPRWRVLSLNETHHLLRSTS